MKAHLLQNIYDIGNRMLEALESEDIDGFYALVQQRGILLTQLRQADEAPGLAEAWDSMSEAFAEQDRILNAAMAEQEHRMSQAIGNTQRFKDAHSTYRQGGPPSGILREGLRG